MVAILKVRRHISSVDAYSLEEQLCQISSRWDLKRWSLELFLKRSPQQEQEQQQEEQDE